MVRERTKKYRGTHYGRGMKAGRGKGKKGGKGNAGVGKHKWIWFVKNDPHHMGKHGFVSPNPSNHKSISLRELTVLLSDLRERGFVTDGDTTVVDLKRAGYTKLLGSGEINGRYTIKIPVATEKAIRKLSAAGSTVETDD